MLIINMTLEKTIRITSINKQKQIEVYYINTPFLSNNNTREIEEVSHG